MEEQKKRRGRVALEATRLVRVPESLIPTVLEIVRARRAEERAEIQVRRALERSGDVKEGA